MVNHYDTKNVFHYSIVHLSLLYKLLTLNKHLFALQKGVYKIVQIQVHFILLGSVLLCTNICRGSVYLFCIRNIEIKK